MPSDAIAPQTARALQHRLAVAQRDGRTPSIVAAVARRGEPVWFGGAGSVDGAPPSEQMQYRIGSITKTMVAVCVLRLVEQGALALTDAIGAHLPDAPAPASTIYQLLTHTSGIASETPPPWWERTSGVHRPQLRDVLPADPMRHPPGRVHHYSNPGFGLLAALVAQHAARPWFDVLADDVLRPLGMTRTEYLPSVPHAQGWAVHPWADVLLPEPIHDHGLLAGAGQLWSTPSDLCRFGVFLSGEASTTPILPADSLEQMRTAAVAPSDATWSASYGLGVQQLRFEDMVVFGHTGSMPGFLAIMMTSLEDGLTISIQTNSWSSGLRALTVDLFSIMKDLEPTMPKPWQAAVQADSAAFALVGPWYWGAEAVALQLRSDGHLEIDGIDGTGRAARFRPLDDGRWLGLDGYYHGEHLAPVRAADGTITHLDLGSFVLTREPYAPAEVIPDGLGLGGWQLG